MFKSTAIALALAVLPMLAAGQVVAAPVQSVQILNGTAPVSNSNPLPTNTTTNVNGFTPSATGAKGTQTTIATSDTSATLPTGAAVVVTNVGTTNPMYCNVNAIAATTSDQLITANGGWFEFTIPNGVTTLRCIATGGSTTANMLGGSGIASGTGGGSGGGGSGGAVSPAAVTPSGLTNYTQGTGGVAQNAITISSGSISGGYICNPATTTGQNVSPVETITVNPFGTATATEGNGNSVLVPGQCYNVPPGTNHNVSWVAATLGHIISGAQYK